MITVSNLPPPKDTDTGSRSENDFARGWNACREEMGNAANVPAKPEAGGFDLKYGDYEMKDWKQQQREDFEAFMLEHLVPIGVKPDLRHGRLNPSNYEDLVVNGAWLGYQAGQDALVGKIQEAFAAIPFPDGHSVESRKHWKSGNRDAIKAVNRALGVGEQQ